MRSDEHKACSVSSGVYLKILGYADKSCVIIAVVLYRGGKDGETEIYPGADRTTLMVVTAHKPGALYKLLSRFNSLGINLLKLESRPLPERDFEFMFYFDLEASVYSERLAKLFAELESECDEFTYLGSYSEVI